MFEEAESRARLPRPSDQGILEAGYEFCDRVRERVERGEELAEILTPPPQAQRVNLFWELAIAHLCPDVASSAHGWHDSQRG